MNDVIEREELRNEIAAGRVVVAEILGPAYYGRGHLPGAVNLPLENFGERAAAVLPDKDAAVVVYCSGPTCNNSHVAHRRLAELGYRNVRVYRGGKSDWQQAGFALELA